MILNVNFLDNKITFSPDYINVIEINNQRYFIRLIDDLFKVSNGVQIEDDVILVDDDFNEINLNNKLKIIVDYFNIDFNNKKYILDINKKIIDLLDDSEKLNIIKEFSKICSIIKKNIYDFDIPLNIDNDLSIESILKTVKISISHNDNILDKLFLIIDLEKMINSSLLLIFINLKQYLSKEELQELYKYAIYNNMQILLIDSQSYGVANQYEKKLIIDENLDEFML